MLWYLPFSESIKKRACRYLLQRYLGNFLEEKLTLDQLSVDLYNGTGTVSDVSLDCEALNDLGDTQNWPLEIVDGHMKEITVTVPWSTLLKDDSVVEINGLSLTVQPKVRAEPVSSMLESMWSSMSSSMQLAAECLREEAGPQESNPVEGIEMFAHAIDSILSRVKVKFINTKIRIEHVPKNGDRGIALEIHIKNVHYFDEAGAEPVPDATDPEKAKTYIVATYTNKKIKFDGVTFYIDEFPSKLRTMAPSLMEKSASSVATKSDGTVESPDSNYQSTMSDIFYETRSVISTIESDPIKEIIGEQQTSIHEATPEERSNQPDPILFAKLGGSQELSLKLKHSDEVEGPKVEVKILLGSFLIFLTPRQLHTIIELIEALNQPHLEDTSNIPIRPHVNMQCKPMKHADFQFIEAQLLGNLEKQHSKPMAMYGWSGPSFEESDAESDKFLPMTSQAAAMAESFTSSVSSMNTSMTSSVNTSSSPKIRRNKRVPHIDGDPTAEVSHISLRIASVSCVLLHKDVLIPTPISGRFVTAASATRLQQLSTEFFSRIQTFTTLDDRRLSSINKSLDAATDRDHLRFLALEISLDGSEKVTAHGSQTVCEAAIRNALLRECLYNQADERHMSFDLVKFENKDDAENSLTSKSNLKVNFKQTSKYLCVSGERKLVHPTTDIVLKCMPFHVDIELSVLDRMCASVWPPPRAAPAPPPATPSAPSHNHLSFALHCPDLALLLRFPIVDLRPGVDRDARRVRPDYLEFKFQNATLSCAQTPSLRPLPTTLSLTSTILDLYYHENEHSTPTHIARSTMDDSKFERNILKGNTATHLPTISLTFQKRESAKPFDSLHDDLSFEPAKPAHPMTTSMYIMDNLRSTLPSPFSGKKMAHQSINKNEANSQGQEEEIIVPGTDEEMAEFTTSAVDNSAIHLDFTLPILSLQLESKQMYEIIYNRINSDLLLWEPRGTDGLPDCPINPAFGACKSAAYDSDSDSSTSDEDNLYYSTYDGKAKKNAAPKVAQDTNENEMHNFCLTFKVGEGLLTIYAPVRDSNKRVVPGQTGELSVRACGVRMCHVSGLRRRARTAQLGLRAADIALYHEPILTIPSEKPSLRLHGSVLPSYLKSTIYRSHSGVIIKDCATNKDIFTIALKTEPDPETPGLKTICIALGIEQATLRHRGGVAWLTQLMDVLDVVDYPVAGYTPSTVLSELHVHVWDCAVDYRPLYLPIRTILTLGNFSVSSNIIPDTSSSHLRFLAQECALFLGRAQEAPPNVHKDYVCVLDLGLFELSVRTDEKSNGSSPALSVTASNNMVNVYTCWDSASALCRLLTYAAADGDSAPPRARSNRTSVCSDSTAETLVGLEDRPIEEIRELSPNEIQQVNDLMAEAMKESPNSALDEDELNSSTEKEGVEVFFFPDESNMKQKQLSSEAIDEDTKSMDFEENKMEDSLHRPTNTQVTKDLGDPTSTPKSTPKRGRKKVASGGDTSTDDEYCMVEAAGDGEMDEPAVTWLGSSLMLDNHFAVPPARADVLAAPKSFPPPVTRYTLCELSLTWHMYGGTDFTPASDAHAKKTVTIDTKRGSPTPSRNKESAAPYLRGVGWSAGGEAVWAAPAPAPRPLRTRGGPKRDHSTCVKLCLTKVKFQHETYGSGGAAASRQTLAVTRLEVLDRVQRSDINKLLSQYRRADEPDRKNAHMVKFQHETYGSGGAAASRQTLAVTRLEVLDRVQRSDINKLLSQYRRADEPDRKNAHMLVVKAVHLRADAALPAQECCLKVSLLPLRFILDQDTLAFLVGFFSKLGSDDNADDDTKNTTGEAGGSRQSTPTHRPPVMSIASHLRDPPPTPTSLGDQDALSLNETVLRDDEPLMETYEAERLVSENLIQLEEDFQRFGMNQEKPTTKQPDTEPLDDSPIYFRRVVFSPEVPIRLDYVGKRVDLSAGPVAGLLMGLGQLNCSELTLKRLDYKLGLLGVERLVQWALAEWVSDIKRHQLPGLLGGIGPMHSLLQILTGIRDLVWLPVEQWRRDGRVVRGLRRGAASFTARAALAALDLTARLLHLIQATAETAFDMLTPSPPLPLTARGRRARRRRADNRQPADLREGVASAYTTVKEGFAETAAQMRWAARRGHSGGVLRQLPGAALAPLALAAAGAADVLGGVRAHIAPQAAVDQQDKWRAPDVTDQS